MVEKRKSVRIPAALIEEMKRYLQEHNDPVLHKADISDSQAAEMLAKVGFKAIRGEYELEYQRRTFERINMAAAAACADVVAVYLDEADVILHDGWPALRTKNDDGSTAITPMPREIVRPGERTIN